jgi:hypothetical protein
MIYSNIGEIGGGGGVTGKMYATVAYGGVCMFDEFSLIQL